MALNLPRKTRSLLDPTVGSDDKKLIAKLQSRFGFTQEMAVTLLGQLGSSSAQALSQNFLHIKNAGFNTEQVLEVAELLGSDVSDVAAWKEIGKLMPACNSDVSIAYYALMAGFDVSNIKNLDPSLLTVEKLKNLSALKQL